MIVFGHTIQGCMAVKFVYSFHVPLFYFLSGVTFKGMPDFLSFFRKKTRTILVPYWAVMLISIIIFYFLGATASSALGVKVKTYSWIECILGSIYGSGKTGYLKANLPLWFLTCLFAFEMLMFWGDRFIAHSRSVFRYWIALLLSIGFLFVNYYLLRLSRLPFGLETACNVLPFGLFGYGLREGYIVIPAVSKLKALLLAVAFGIGCFVLGCCVNTRVVDVIIDSYGNLNLYLIAAICGILMVYFLSQVIHNNAVLSYIGKNTLVILLLHKFPILFFQVIFGPTKALLAENNELAGAFVSMISVAMCLLAGIVIDKVCPWLVGRQRTK